MIYGTNLFGRTKPEVCCKTIPGPQQTPESRPRTPCAAQTTSPSLGFSAGKSDGQSSSTCPLPHLSPSQQAVHKHHHWRQWHRHLHGQKAQLTHAHQRSQKAKLTHVHQHWQKVQLQHRLPAKGTSFFEKLLRLLLKQDPK